VSCQLLCTGNLFPEPEDILVLLHFDVMKLQQIKMRHNLNTWEQKRLSRHAQADPVQGHFAEGILMPRSCFKFSRVEVTIVPGGVLWRHPDT
jgi:hypothetical protein